MGACASNLALCGQDLLPANHSSEAVSDVFTWGSGSHGQLGHGSKATCQTPQAVSGLSSVPLVGVALGDSHALFLDENGRIYSCGRNNHGQLGDGTKDTRSTPEVIAIRPPSGSNTISFTIIAAGADHCLALSVAGDMYSWGCGKYGKLGLGECGDVNIPQKIDSFIRKDRVVAVSCGTHHSVCMTENGRVYEWGNLFAKVIPPLAGSDNPEEVPYFKKAPARMIEAGSVHNIVVLRSGEVCTWGVNSAGQLGHGSTTNVAKPTIVKKLTDNKDVGSIVQIGAGSGFSCAVDEHGQVLGWGTHGCVGKSSHSVPEPILVPTRNINGKVVRISCGGEMLMGLTSKNIVVCWEPLPRSNSTSSRLSNVDQQLADAGLADRYPPHRVPALGGCDVRAIACGEAMCAVLCNVRPRTVD